MKKKNFLTKKEKRIFIGLGILLIIFILIIILLPTGEKQTQLQQPTVSQDLNQELTTVKEVVEYLESTYLYEEPSTENGYETDIYLSFKFNLYEGDESQEIYFKNFYEKIAMVTNFKSFRLIDKTKGITIAVKCNNGKISEVKINGEVDYFKKESSRRSRIKELNVETLDLEVNSSILQSLINSGWRTGNVNLGTQESTFDKYQVYFDEGYEVRTIQGRVFNIVFTQNYDEKVVAGYKVGDNLDTIKSQLGTSYDSQSIIGYKTKNFYVYFSRKSISIYPNMQYDYTDFENLVKEYNETKDTNDFLYKLTDVWPDYDSYRTGTNDFEIYYSLKGVKISFNNADSEGIQIFENYKGDLRTNKDELKDVYYHLDENLIIQKEQLRQMKTAFYDNSGKEDEPLKYSDKFYVSATSSDGYYRNFQILSIDGQYPNNEFDDNVVVYGYVWADDSNLIYTVEGKGMYIYNAETRQTETLIEGNDNFEIKDYDRNTHIIKYDDTEVRIEF